MDRELIATVMPDGNLLLEFLDTDEKVEKSQQFLQKEIYRRYDIENFEWLLFLGFRDKEVPLSTSLNYWRDFASLFDKKLSQTQDLENLREKVVVELTDEELEYYISGAPLSTGFEYLNDELLKSIWQELNKLFCRLVSKYEGSVEDFIHTFSPDVHLAGRVFFHLVENKDDDRPFAFLATYSSKFSKKGKSAHIPLKHALKECEGDSAKLLELLSTVHTAARDSDLVFDLLSTGEIFHPLSWSSKDAFQFLKEIPIYEKAGVLCRMPNWWKPASSGFNVDINIGENRKTYLSQNDLLSYDVRLCIDGMQISAREAEELLEQSEGLAKIKNKWVAVDPEKLKQTLEAYEKARELAKDGFITIQDALRLEFQTDRMLDITDESNTTVSHGEWLHGIMDKLKNPSLISSVKTNKSFKGKLREYQQRGLNWLYFLHSLQFGACLADDMGLGKTVQILAFLNVLKGKKEIGTNLLIVPASLISNWASEIETFFPKLKYIVAHSQGPVDKRIETQSSEDLKNVNLVITTYGLAQKHKWIKDFCWNYIILDEAQAIKNTNTKQTKAIKSLKSANRIILTGTPIENKLFDLWSLFDFLNPGLLGDANEFKAFTSKLVDDSRGYARLRRTVSPYVLRRMKSDKSIIADLPDKVEMKTYAPISKKQVVLYEDLVKKIAEMIEKTEGIHRKGLILSSLIKFKQLCNHPDQYLGTGPFLEDDSGKFIRLKEICETIYEKRERVLVFTQFKEMTEPLANFLEDIFQHKGVIFHGSVPVGQRKKIIEKFQGIDYVPFMVLSLKAGGVGLNLTKANHVIHFDRWWNPAVENQATDRAFRIGQTKNVMVHKFLMEGTIEEKIDMMLEDKTELSNSVIAATNESWITEMKDEQVLDMFKLSL